MKFNKKITVTALSTVLGLGLVGSISGAVAWYQYSTRATTSIIGTSTGSGGTLQIKKDGGEWVRDLNTNDVLPGSFKGFLPVTFSGFDGTDDEATLPAQAYKEPSRVDEQTTEQDHWYDNWKTATVNEDYLQYTVYLQAMELDDDGTYARKDLDVKLNNIIIADAAANPTIANSIRVNVFVENMNGSSVESTANYLFSVGDYSSTGLSTYGYLDLDGDGDLDTVGAYEWEKTDEKIIYGEDTVAKQSLKSIQASGFDQVICKTPADASHETKITITIWSEGWSLLDGDDATWNQTGHIGENSFHVGLTFDLGDNPFNQD